MNPSGRAAAPASSRAHARFAALGVRNYRLIWAGLGISQTGRAMTTVAQSLFVYELTGSATALGILTALQFLPILLLGAWTGLVVDRADKRRLLRAVEVFAACNALALMAVAMVDEPPLLPIYLLAVGSGVCAAFEDPARRALPMDLVPPPMIQSAVGLTSGMNTVAAMAGPAIAAVLTSTVGYAWCFAIDAVSYVAVIGAVTLMDPAEIRRPAPRTAQRGEIRQGIEYVRTTHELLVPLVVMAFVGMLAVNHNVTLPVLIKEAFGRPSGAFALLMSTLSVGSFVGAVVMAARRSLVAIDGVHRTALAMGVSLLAMALNPWFATAYVAAAMIGFTSAQFTTTCTSIVQMRSADAMRGRVLSLQMITYLGVTPIGGPIIGVASDVLGPRSGLAIGAAACVGAGMWARQYGRRVTGRLAMAPASTA